MFGLRHACITYAFMESVADLPTSPVREAAGPVVMSHRGHTARPAAEDTHSNAEAVMSGSTGSRSPRARPCRFFHARRLWRGLQQSGRPAPQAIVMAVHASPDAPYGPARVDGVVTGKRARLRTTPDICRLPGGAKREDQRGPGPAPQLSTPTFQWWRGELQRVRDRRGRVVAATLVLTDDLTIQRSSKAHPLCVHLSPDAPAVDVAVTGRASAVPQPGLPRLHRVHSGGCRHVRPRGAGREDDTVAPPVPGVALQAGEIYGIRARFPVRVGAQALRAQVINK